MTKIKLIIYSALGIALVTFFFLWRNTASNLQNTQKCLTEAQQTIESLKQDNDNLLKYNQIRDKKLQELQIQYEQVLKNYPKDACGDQKPSPELLEYLRSY